ncbi:MAG: beta-ketoacyl-ACP synthase II [Bacteroidales bacterium]|nr:beta-ketoacyl-ACP synthase II [Bacteroidales bacterium]
MKRVVVTGIGTINPLGNDSDTFWNNMMQGKSGASLIDRFDTTNYKSKFACQVKDFDPHNYMEKAEARKMDLFAQYAIAAAEECMQDTGFDSDKWDLDRVGAIWASGIGGIHTFEDAVIDMCKCENEIKMSPFFITKLITNMAAGLITIRYGLKNVSHAIVSACASSNSAIVDAYNYIRLGKADAILTGGSEACISRSALGGFNASRALSTNNENYLTASRPFDKTRDGFVMGEGAGALMLEDLDHALKRGAKIYCEIIGSGLASDAYHVTATHPEGLGAERAMREALREANMLPNEVDYINAHATATPQGDPCECKAIGRVFENSLDSLNISATKSMTGHLLGAAGAVEAIAGILSIKHNKIPPTINFTELDEQISPKLNLTVNQPVEKEVNVVMNNTFGFGGHIAVSLFKRY